MRVLFAYPQSAFLRDYEKAYVGLVSAELQASGNASGLIPESDPARADLIILLESAQYKSSEYVRILENEPLIRDHAERVFTINYDDHPEGLIAGLYTSIEKPFFNPQRHGSWPILLMNNPLVYGLQTPEVLGPEPTRLFSFVGAASHEIRKKLFRRFAKSSPDYQVEEIYKWYNHNDNDRRRFVQITADSQFCLCPRGYASYTNRISEVMAMARVPVIIADDWIPFSFEEVVPYYIQIPEKDIEHIPEILAARRNEADHLRRNARNLWVRNCSLSRRVVAAVERIASLAASAAPKTSYQDYRALWHSRRFRLNAGWTSGQKLALRLEQHIRRFFPSARVPGVSALMRYRNAPNLK